MSFGHKGGQTDGLMDYIMRWEMRETKIVRQ